MKGEKGEVGAVGRRGPRGVIGNTGAKGDQVCHHSTSLTFHMLLQCNAFVTECLGKPFQITIICT